MPNTCKSNGQLSVGSIFSGERVSNAEATCPLDGVNIPKVMLIPDVTLLSHEGSVKDGLYMQAIAKGGARV